MHVLALVLPISLVAYDVLKVFVALDIVRTNDFACFLYHLVRNARLTGYLDGERRTRLSDGKLEERSHLMPVVEHGTVGDAVVRVGVMLEVLIVSGDDAPRHAFHKLIEHSLCHSAANLRLRTRTKLVDEQQSAVACLLHHILHVQEMRRVCGEIVLNALLVTDVNHDVGEYSHLRTLTHRYGQTALQHILQQTNRLQTHRFTSGVRTGDDEDVTVAGQCYVERNGGLVLLFQSQPQERMACRNPVHHRLLVHFRLDGVGKVGKFGTRADEVHLCKHQISIYDVLHVRTYQLRKLRQNNYDFTALVSFKFTYAVVRFHHLSRFHEHRLTRRRLVMHNTFYTALHGRSDRHHETSVADGRRHVLVDETLALSCVQDAVKCS